MFRSLVQSDLNDAFAVATGFAGLAVAETMRLSIATYLPDLWLFFPAAFVGAALAGWAFVSGFGRAGLTGWLIAGLSAAVMTAIGAGIGGSLAAFLSEGAHQSGFYLGVLALAFVADAGWPVCVWVACMSGLHVTARTLRDVQSPHQADQLR